MGGRMAPLVALGSNDSHIEGHRLHGLTDYECRRLADRRADLWGVDTGNRSVGFAVDLRVDHRSTGSAEHVCWNRLLARARLGPIRILHMGGELRRADSPLARPSA